MAIFHIEGSGLIQTDELPSGDMTVKHTGRGLVFDIVNESCGNGRGYWNEPYKNWIVFKQFAAQVLTEFEAKGKRIEQ
jgi:hypothetical protein